MKNWTHKDYADFKSQYAASNLRVTNTVRIDDARSIDEKFKQMALASRQKFYLNNKHTDIQQRLPFKGQLSELRYIPLKDVQDGKQLDDIKAHLRKMEKDLAYILKYYEEDS